jgi:hypothetical protein
VAMLGPLEVRAGSGALTSQELRVAAAVQRAPHPQPRRPA